MQGVKPGRGKTAIANSLYKSKRMWLGPMIAGYVHRWDACKEGAMRCIRRSYWHPPYLKRGTPTTYRYWYQRPCLGDRKSRLRICSFLYHVPKLLVLGSFGSTPLLTCTSCTSEIQPSVPRPSRRDGGRARGESPEGVEDPIIGNILPSQGIRLVGRR